MGTINIQGLLEKWLSPTGLTIIVGVVIWLIQLNIGYITLKSIVDRLVLDSNTHTEMLSNITMQQAATSLILKNIQSDIQEVDEYIDSDHSEVRMLDKSIDRTQTILNNHIQNHRGKTNEPR